MYVILKVLFDFALEVWFSNAKCTSYVHLYLHREFSHYVLTFQAVKVNFRL